MEVLKNKNKQLEGLIIALESKLDKSNCLFQDILNKANDYKKFSEEQADLAKSEKEENKKMKVKIEEMDKSIKEYFVEMCKNYPYVAIGGIVTKEIPINKYEKLFPWFVNTAH